MTHAALSPAAPGIDAGRRRSPAFPPYSNPTTSYEAALAIQPYVNPQQGRVLAWLRDHGPATDEAIQIGTGLAQNSERPRRKELWSMGLVEDSGERHQTASGRNAIAWCAVDAQAVLL